VMEEGLVHVIDERPKVLLALLDFLQDWPDGVDGR
jgi:hypothetical protein